MAALTGGRVRTPRGVLSWQPARPVATMFAFYTANAKDGYVCAGVIGNSAHLGRTPPEDHTPYSQDTVTIGGRRYVPKVGWVYAIDGHVPEQAKFEKWFVARLRAGYYPWVKYFNINNHHWRRSDRWARATYSGDVHLHVSVMPGSEYASGDLLADYEHFRTTGRNVGVKVPAAAPARPGVVDAAARKLPSVHVGNTGLVVKLAQAALVAGGYLTKTKDSVDGVFGPHTEAGVRKAETASKLPSNGVVDTATWDAIYPERTGTISRGSSGSAALLMQALLLARGYDPRGLDGEFGDDSVAALKRFQVAAKVKNSVVKGKGDGIGGDATWVSLLTV